MKLLPGTDAALLLAAVTVALSPGQEHQHGAGTYGDVKFTTSCNAAAQPVFTRGVTLLHSYEFGQAIESFTAAAGNDPACGIAYWGVALARWGNPFAAGRKPAAQLAQGAAAVERARAVGATTARARAHIEAGGSLYDGLGTVDQRTRVVAYRDAMARVADTYAD